MWRAENGLCMVVFVTQRGNRFPKSPRDIKKDYYKENNEQY